MGRGRAKAKQTKVARELKYHSPNTDLEALQRELAGSSNGNSVTPDVERDDAEDGYDKYSSYASDDEDDDASWAQRK
jgi:hypothetical protein